MARYRSLFPALMLGVALAPAAPWDTRSDSWVATDALGRQLPKAPQPRKPTGSWGSSIFFGWGARDAGPFDITKILRKSPRAMADPKRPPVGADRCAAPLGEPAFGYYVSNDE